MGNSILFPHTPPTYGLEDLIGANNLFFVPEEIGNWPNPKSQKLPDSSEVFRGEFFPVQFFPAKSEQGSRHVFIYFHGNSCDMGEMAQEICQINEFTECHILSFEYPGYGICQKPGMWPQPDRIDRWGRAVAFMLIAMGVEAKSIIPFGRSIGTGPAAKLAACMVDLSMPPGGLMLHSPYLSIHKIVTDYATSAATYVVPNYWDTEKVLKTLERSLTPLLVIHGCNDEVIPVQHGRELVSGYNVTQEKEGFFPRDSEHNSYYVIDDVSVPIKNFVRTKASNKSGTGQMVSMPTWARNIPPTYFGESGRRIPETPEVSSPLWKNWLMNLLCGGCGNPPLPLNEDSPPPVTVFAPNNQIYKAQNSHNSGQEEKNEGH